MKHFYRLLWVGLVSGSVFLAPLSARAESLDMPPDPVPAPFLSEVGWAGSSAGPADEFLELMNPTPAPLSLAGWSLTGAGTKGEALLFPDDATIPPYSTYLTTNYEPASDGSALATPSNFVTSRLSLPNTQLSVALVDGTGVVVDRAGDGTGTPPAGHVPDPENNVAGASMTRLSASMDGSLDEAWAESATSSGWKEGALDLGTPGWHEWNVENVEAVESSLSAGLVETVIGGVPEPRQEEQAMELISEPAPEPAPEPENIGGATAPRQEEEPVEEVFPANTNDPAGIITVLYEGFTFELNLPGEEKIVEDVESSRSAGLVETVIGGVPEPRQEEQAMELISEPAPEPKPEHISEPAAEPAPAPDPEPAALEIPTITIAPTDNVAEVVMAATSFTPSPKTLRFSEVYPSTVGGDEAEEYIEIENVGDAPVDLLSWSVHDAGGKTWTAGGTHAFSAHLFVALPRSTTKITLNNDADTLELLAPDEEIVDTVSYAGAKKGETYARVNGAWVWAEPTPNAANVALPVTQEPVSATPSPVDEPEPLVISSVTVTPAPAPSEPEPEPEPTPASTLQTEPKQQQTPNVSKKTMATFRSMTIGEAREAGIGDRVRVEGTVTAAPGTFATQSFYLSDDAGIQVYLYSADFPPLQAGDRVRVEGTVSQSRGEARLKISSVDAIHTIGSEALAAQVIPLEEIGEETESELVVIEALVESARETDMTLTEGEINVVVTARPRTGVSFAGVTSGDRVRVTGVVSETDGSYHLLPRNQSDITVLEDTSKESPVSSGTALSSRPPTGLYGGLLLLSALAVLAFWYLRARRTEDLTLIHV